MWRNDQPPARRLAIDALLLAAAMLFSYVESLLPLSLLIPIPGLKPGLCNVVIFLALSFAGIPDAAAVSVLRVLLSSVLFGNLSGFLFSLLGSVCSLLVQIILLCFLRGRFSPFAVCIASAMFHNLGQLIATGLLYGFSVAGAYAFYLLTVAVPCGVLTGLVVTFVISPVKKLLFRERTI